MHNYNIPKNTYYKSIRIPVVQRLIDFYLNNFGGNYYNGIWIIGKTQGLCKNESGEDKLFTVNTGNTNIDVVYPTKEELLEFERVWLEAGYFVSFAYDKGEKCVAFTNYPYKEYNFRVIKASLKYYLE